MEALAGAMGILLLLFVTNVSLVLWGIVEYFIYGSCPVSNEFGCHTWILVAGYLTPFVLFAWWCIYDTRQLNKKD